MSAADELLALVLLLRWRERDVIETEGEEVPTEEQKEAA